MSRPRGRIGRVVVVGLGPAGVDLLVPAARDALERHAVRFARTARHPAVADLAAAGIDLASFDERYEQAADLDACYRSIVTAVIDAAAEHGTVAYAVPGSPAVAERTVELLHDAAREGGIELEVVPGMSFADLAWARLGVDPLTTGARVVDGRALDPAAVDPSRPLLVAQCDHALVLSDVKLALLEHHDPATGVIVLQRLGLADEQVAPVALEDLDRAVVPDHLTSIFVPGVGSSPTRELGRLLALAARLRGPGGCPWDAEQTHHSLTRYLLEESYEVVEAVEGLPADAPAGVAADDPRYAALVDELGDLLYQVIFHAVLAEEAGAFDMGDVARGIHDKLVRRHPHVFGDTAAETSDAVMANWEQIKKEEKGVESIVAGITPGLPSLLYAHKLLRKAASVGLEPDDVARSLARIDAAVAVLRAAGGTDEEQALGELLAATVALARALGVDTESALRGWSARFRARFERMEQLALDRDLDLHALAPAEVEALWEET
ncbi:MAG TPA: nucleoside triphosphate pyrophosphohydrolase [Acidimicrobiia bacterium]